MKTLKFKCTLLSDLILNVSAATEGVQKTLDYIPGSCFLGIMARDYDKYTPQEQITLFHSGRVRFGDAHVCVGGNDTLRSLHVPATLFYPKGRSASEICIAWQDYSREEDRRLHKVPMQLKQCRKGYYLFSDNKGVTEEISKTFTVKSSYDRDRRRALDSRLFGYESLNGGQSFLFEVETDDDSLADRIKTSLVGRKRIGRSRTAQYGTIDIEPADFRDYPSSAQPIPTKNGPRVAVYADSRLIFLDETGQPVFTPTAEQLGLDGDIDWELSQVRTFQYAPWNGKRQSRDEDRCGIEKGSVFFVDTKTAAPAAHHVGSYRNEGFGRVIYNPAFLLSDGENGKARFVLEELRDCERSQCETSAAPQLSGTPLLDYLSSAKHRHEEELRIMEAVNDFVDHNSRRFRGDTFASQWGTIRKIAMSHPSRDQILYELFEKKEKRWHWASQDDPSEGYREVPTGYLVHGVAAKKWKNGGRSRLLREFIEGSADSYRIDDRYIQQAVVNLASEMAKICRNNGKD
jgi:hypothetical protein